jgi:hypothetical protein
MKDSRDSYEEGSAVAIDGIQGGGLSKRTVLAKLTNHYAPELKDTACVQCSMHFENIIEMYDRTFPSNLRLLRYHHRLQR